jgi:antitoxin component YwqK of YwqJK toxin-antitoxin module
MPSDSELAGTAHYHSKFLPSKRAYFGACYALKNLNTFGDFLQCWRRKHTRHGSICPSFKQLLNNKKGCNSATNRVYDAKKFKSHSVKSIPMITLPKISVMRLILLSLFASLFLTCQQTSPTVVEEVVEVATVDDKEYEITDIPGTTFKKAERKDPLGAIIEAGFVLDGKKHGTWTTYNQDSQAPEIFMSYIDGALNGPYIEMDAQGRYALIANYKANKLHGHYGKYRIGRAELTANYIDGALDGVMAEYNYRNQKIKQEVSYKMGLKHGFMRYYNDEGKITLEYLYKDDERVSGGIKE